MTFISETVAGFFGRNRIQFTIPAYQRAYSWDDSQTKSFLEDLLEHKNHSDTTPYCYGNILLETIAEAKKYEIIDGQQRLTTLSIFMRALLNAFSERIDGDHTISISENEPLDIIAEEEIYFKDHGIIKLRPTTYDQACYDTIIIDNQPSFNARTPSQKRMINAKEYFSEELRKLGDSDLINIFKTVRATKINRIELSDKKEAALMFELQNNRGKELTNLEKLKSFLMYQLYVYSLPEETNTNIEKITNYFNPIYNITNDMSLQLGNDDDDGNTNAVNEDNILIYHSYAYSKKNFGYRNLNDIIEEFKTVPNTEKVSWIISYSRALYDSFSSISSILAMNDVFLNKLKKMKIPFFVYPFLIKGSKNRESLSSLFRLLEVLSFRYKLIGSRADIRGRLNELIREFDGNVDALAIKMKNKMEEAYYWGDKKFIEILNGNMYQNNMIYYFLWEYEQSLQRKGYIINGSISVESESIEHISPQTEPDEQVSTGYQIESDGRYSAEYRENYINKLGNLLLISQSHNSSIGNKPFSIKLDSYINNPLLKQQIQIKEYVDETKGIWDACSIDKRHNEMISFAIDRWGFVKAAK
ncbi:MAG: DUF262 domain-containing HNH endonuclease family protein [Clostridiales bacterium]|nr:DUF262 domain-containing HNH endonuclease family protein [Clostridiales bacterium]